MTKSFVLCGSVFKTFFTVAVILAAPSFIECESSKKIREYLVFIFLLYNQFVDWQNFCCIKISVIYVIDQKYK